MQAREGARSFLVGESLSRERRSVKENDASVTFVNAR
jgi:hypothetical protein